MTELACYYCLQRFDEELNVRQECPRCGIDSLVLSKKFDEEALVGKHFDSFCRGINGKNEQMVSFKGKWYKIKDILK